MKNIKRKILQISLTVFMVFSSCFLTGTVKAEDTTSDTGSSNYFENNLIVDSDSIIGESNFKGEKPTFKESAYDKGSDLSEGATEGQVWTNKIIEKAGQDGMYKITFQAIGFKYRYVDDDNEKDDDIWKNPLKEGTTLSITEDIDPNFDVVTNDDLYKMSVTKFVGLNERNITFKENNGQVELIFNADNVNLEISKEDSDYGFAYDTNNETDNGIAFDVEAVFFVRIDNSVGAGTYETEDAKSVFTPQEDNFYYYEWGAIESTYKIDGLKWRNNDDHWSRIQEPNKASGTIYFPDINGHSASFTIPENWYASHGIDGQYYDKDNVLREGEYKEATSGFSGDGIKSIKFYVSGKKSDIYIYFRIVITYDTIPETQIIFEPHSVLPSNGGNDDSEIILDTIVSKDKPVLRDNVDSDGDGIIDESFTNHGQIVLKTITIDNVETKKTASLIDWDDRTYRIDLYAASSLIQQSAPVDIMFALDFSGSMPWLIEKPAQTTKLETINTKENRDKFLIKHNVTMGTIDKWQSFEYFIYDSNEKEYKPIGYFNTDEDHTGWYALKSGGTGTNVKKGSIRYDEDLKVNDDTTIYIKGDNKTKLDELLLQVQSFIDSLAVSSPNSMIGFNVFAGQDIATSSELKSAETLKGNGLNSFLTSKNVYLAGNTAQGVGISKSNELLKAKGMNKDKYIILFTDGKEKNDENQISAIDAANEARDDGNKVYTIGLANSSVLDDMQGDLKSWAYNEDYYFATSNYTEFEQAFNSIFDDLVGSIKNVIITDVIDSRFELIDGEKERLEQIPGVTVDGNTITWNIEELRYNSNVLEGAHLWIDIRAKDNFLGGNYIPTNVPNQSVVTVNGESRELDKPVVNVKPILDLNDGEKTYFLGENINPVEFIDTLLNGSNCSLSVDQKNQLISGNQVQFEYSYGGTNDIVGKLTFKYEPITENGKVSVLNSHYATKSGDSVEQYKLIVNYEVSTIDERKGKLSGYVYTDTSFTSEHGTCEHTDNEHLKNKAHVADNVEVYGFYDVNVVDGSITINKNINEITNTESQGDAIFTFLIEGETVSGKKIHEYKVLRFNTNNPQSFTLSNLEKGKYKITELQSIRYNLDQITISKNDTNIPNDINKDDKSITVWIGYDTNQSSTNISAKDIEVTYQNTLINKDSIGDTDVVTNSFTVNDDGSVTIEKDYHTVNQD